jgi:hypothetical protein
MTYPTRSVGLIVIDEALIQQVANDEYSAALQSEHYSANLEAMAERCASAADAITSQPDNEQHR